MLEANPLGTRVDDSETMGYLCSLGTFCLDRLCLKHLVIVEGEAILKPSASLRLADVFSERCEEFAKCGSHAHGHVVSRCR